MGTEEGVVLRVRVVPGSSREELQWDPWRNAWTVHVRTLPLHGRANEKVRDLFALWLGLPEESIRWVRAGASRDKSLRIRGLLAGEIEARLRERAGPAQRVHGSG